MSNADTSKFEKLKHVTLYFYTITSMLPH